jgi:hypothetical protein
MDEIVKSRLIEVCPHQEISEVDVIEVEKSCYVAFEIIGYKPKNFTRAFQKTWESSDATLLSEFIFEVWGNDQ